MEDPEDETKYHVKPQSSVSLFLLSPTRPYTVSLFAASTTLLLRTLSSSSSSSYSSSSLSSSSSSSPSSSVSSFSAQRLTPQNYLLPARSSLVLSSLNLVWLGFDLSICFMEAWVKFNAPSVKREQLLDVGRHVFSALNTVEICMAWTGLWLATLVPGPRREAVVAMGTLAGLVFFEGFYMIPALSKRISDTIKGREVVKSHLHAVEALISVAKVTILGSTAVFAYLVM